MSLLSRLPNPLAGRARGLLGTAMLLVAIVAGVPDAHAQREFARRFPAAAAQPLSTQGDITLLGNSSLICPAAAANCATALAGGAFRNNNFTMTTVNVDPDGGANSNSSSASLAMPAGSTVLFAGLYWAGNNATAARGSVRLRAPVGGYTTVTAAATDVIGGAYQSFANVTTLVAAGGNGAYTVGNVALTVGGGQWAGWTLVVAYRNPSLALRNLSIFDGFQYGDSSNPQIDITISGFFTPAAGPVNTNIGIVVYDGDRGQNDDAGGNPSMLFGPNTASLTSVSDAINPVADFWNSSVSFQGTNVIAGRNPGSANTLGIDIDNVRPNTPLPNGATSAVVRTRANNADVNYPGVITLATDVFEPEIVTNFSKTATDGNGAPFRPGDVVTYTISVSNTGNDSATNTVISDPLPADVTFVPGSLQIVSGPNAGIKSDAAGDDQSEYVVATRRAVFRVGTGADATNGGTLQPVPAANSATVVSFRVTINPAVPNGAVISNVASIDYVGGTTGQPGSGSNPPTSFTVSRDADLSITKTGPATILPGGSLSYLVTVLSAGPDAADGATVTDDVPNSLTGVTITCAAAGGAVCPVTTGLTDLTALAIPTLPGGGSVAFTITGTAPASGTLSNSASVAAPAGTVDPTPGNNTAGPVVTTVDSVADVSVVKTLTTPGPYLIGQMLNFSIVVSNAGPIAATNVAVSDTPSNLVLGAVGGDCVALPCTIASIPAGGSATISVSATIVAEGAFSNAATATATEADPNAANNTSTASGVTTPTADLTVAKTLLNAGPVRTRDTVAYQIVVTNQGPSAVAGATVSDIVPPQLTGVTWTCAPAANCSVASGSGDINILASLASGASLTILISGTAPATTPSIIAANTATASPPAGTTDPTPGDNSSTTPVITVAARAIVANNDAAGPVSGSTGASNVINAVANDTLNGAPVTLGAGGNATLAPVTNGPLTVNADGSVDVAPNTAAGTYTASYTICEVLNPGNCATATVTVTVTAAAIIANDDTGSPVNGANGGVVIASVLSNDTLNGASIAPAAATITVATPAANPGVVLNTGTGEVTVAAGTPAGTYTIAYRICEVLNPTNCDSAIATVVVNAAVIDAVDDTLVTPVNGRSGATGVVQVLGNDTLNGAAVAPGSVTLIPVTSGPLSVNADGSVDVAANTAAGTYTLAYRICEALNPSNCDTAVVTVSIVAASITATDDTAGGNGTSPQNIPVTITVLGNDRLNGAPVDPVQVTVTVANPPGNGTATVNPDGTITYTPNPNFSGSDNYTYTLCERLNPGNCATATVTIIVQANVVIANDDSVQTPQQVSMAINVIGNDSSQGAPLDPGSVAVTTAPANGTVTCSAGVCTYTPNQFFAGTDGFSYRVCDTSTPTPVCDTATVAITVNANAAVLRLSKQSGTRDIKVGDLVRYTVVAENVGDAPARDVTLLDSPPAGFTYVDGSLAVDDDNDAGLLTGTNPLRITGIDVAIGARATIVYYLRVGAGVGKGLHTNTVSALAADGAPISNVASVAVEIAGDPLLDDSLILGSVFDDRNGNGVQDAGERGIPGVRIASVEGLVMQTDGHGRYHVAGIEAGSSGRGRNFILKVDRATLPAGSAFTTENPRVRRITPGLPVRFDFGVRLPAGEIGGGRSVTDIELGEVMFEAGSAEVKTGYAPMFETIAGKLRDADGGSVTITARAEQEVLALARAHAVRTMLATKLDPSLASKVKVDVVAGSTPAQPLVSLDATIKLGELLFDTDSTTIRPQYRGLIREIAEVLNRDGRGVIGIVGRADSRGTSDYNVQLGLRRAQAVLDAISSELKPDVRQKVRVDITDDPGAVTGVGER